jgi:hypothetical protein
MWWMINPWVKLVKSRDISQQPSVSATSGSVMTGRSGWQPAPHSLTCLPIQANLQVNFEILSQRPSTPQNGDSFKMRRKTRKSLVHLSIFGTILFFIIYLNRPSPSNSKTFDWNNSLQDHFSHTPRSSRSMPGLS